MAIASNSIGNNFVQSDVQQARHLRTELKIREATLTTTLELPPELIQEHQNFYNKTVGDIDSIRNGNACGCNKLKPLDLDKIFGRSDDKRVEDATAPHLFDNKGAKKVRSEYQKNFREAKRERARAERTAEKLGPGEHTLSNGDQVKVSQDPKTGKKTVTTTKPDGTTKTVSFDPKKPDSVSVKTQNPDGSSTELTRDGTKVTKSTTDGDGRAVKQDLGKAIGKGVGGGLGETIVDQPYKPIEDDQNRGGSSGVGGGDDRGGGGSIRDGREVVKDLRDGTCGEGGKTTTEIYDLDENGNPVKETIGPGEDDYTKITVNEDGSTDTRDKIYEEGCEPVYHDTHEEPGWHFPEPPVRPQPWILPSPWWRARDCNDDFDRHSIPGLKARAQ